MIPSAILEQPEARPSFPTITDTKIMGKIGFNCQLLLSKIGLTTDLSHNTRFHKPYRSKSSRFYMKKIWLSMFYSIRLGEEPILVFFKKERNKNQVKMIGINPFFLRQRSYHFRRNWSYISFPFKSSYVFPRPFEMDKFLFLTNSFS
jgi:hypothetical protein